MIQATLCLLIKKDKILEGKKLKAKFIFKQGEKIAQHNIKIVDEEEKQKRVLV